MDRCWQPAGESGCKPDVDASIGGQIGARHSGSSGSAYAFDVQAIVNAHLFGVAAVRAPSTRPTVAGHADEPRAGRARSPQTDPGQGLAIIGESAAVARRFTRSARPSLAGTKLHSVYPDRVILDRGGKLEALLLPKQFQGGTRMPRRA